MLKTRYKGFVSNEYVWVSIVFSVIQGFYLFLMFTLLIDWIAGIIVASLFVAVFTVDAYVKAPFAYRRVTIDENGIKIGDKILKHSEITNVYIAEGGVESRFGFPMLEKFIGIKQHYDIFVEDIFCLNCDFVGFKSADTDNLIYVPRNARSEACLMQYLSITPRETTYRKCDKGTKNRLLTLLCLCIIMVPFLIIIIALPETVSLKLVCSILLAAFMLMIFYKLHAHYFISKILTYIYENKIKTVKIILVIFAAVVLTQLLAPILLFLLMSFT